MPLYLEWCQSCKKIHIFGGGMEVEERTYNIPLVLEGYIVVYALEFLPTQQHHEDLHLVPMTDFVVTCVEKPGLGKLVLNQRKLTYLV